VRTSLRWASFACVALGVLALAAGPASGHRAIRIEPAGEIGKVVDEFTIVFFGGEVSVICKLTLNGRLFRPILKASARLLPEGIMGQISSAATAGCRTNFGGAAEVTILVEPEAPLDLRYDAFLGPLPEINGIVFTKLNFEFQVIEPMFIGTCLYSGPIHLLMAFPPVEDGRGRRFNPESFVVPNRIPRVGGMLCWAEVEVRGRGRIVPPQGALLED
jgi:hypothetical protein